MSEDGLVVEDRDFVEAPLAPHVVVRLPIKQGIVGRNNIGPIGQPVSFPYVCDGAVVPMSECGLVWQWELVSS